MKPLDIYNKTISSKEICEFYLDEVISTYAQALAENVNRNVFVNVRGMLSWNVLEIELEQYSFTVKRRFLKELPETFQFSNAWDKLC